MGEEQVGKIGVRAPIMTSEFIREGRPKHEASLLEPEDRYEQTEEKGAFDGRGRHKTLREC